MRWKVFTLSASLLAVLFWFSVGVYFFANGFLLTRHELNFKSSCHQIEKLMTNNADKIIDTCWTVPSVNGVYKKFVLVVIDALRFDFASYQTEPTDNLAYKNQLKVFRDLSTNYGCKSSRLFRFRADAPTTTMQRIKGLTTGSFPTFIDVSNNFDSAEISEDNFIDQIRAKGHENITFLGDDTWMKLFPGRFETAYDFPSFDVKDLHLVDNGIMRHLVPELKKHNWKMLIAHFLGVDHCGHRYGPMHSEMSSKLQQMDGVLRSVVDALDEDTLLLVMGDHGMTQTGDHGGETPEEVDAALFAFSRLGKFSDSNLNDNCEAGLVHQIDLVPTLSLLLGVPIPFSNLGSVIPDLIPQSEVQGISSSNLEKSLQVNAKQIETYLREYSDRYENFKSDNILELIHSFKSLRKERTPADEMLHLLHKARDTCKSVWARFDENLIVLGLSQFTIVCIGLLCGNNFTNKARTIFMCTIISSFLFSICFYYTHQVFLLLFLLAVLLFNIMYLLWKSKISFIGSISMLYPILYSSNSFVLSEDAISMFVFGSALFWCSFDVIKQLKAAPTQRQVKDVKKQKSAMRVKQSFFARLNKPYHLVFLSAAVSGILLRFIFHFRICRPEQYWCFYSSNQELTSNASTNSTTGLYYIDDVLDITQPWTRFFVSGGSLAAILYILSWCLKREGNLRTPYSAAVACGTKLLPLAGLCVILNWQLHTFPAKDLDALPDSFITFLPRCAYVLVLISFFFWFISPLTVHVMYMDKHGRYQDKLVLSEQQIISYYYQQLKIQSSKSAQELHHPDADIPPPAVFGPYTLLSSAVLGFAEVFIVLIAMLLEEKYAIVLLSFVLCTWFLLEVVSGLNKSSNATFNKISWDAVGLWMLSSSYWWFATGHQSSLSSIPWNSAFVGFRGSHPSVVLPALMVGTNIFSSQVLHTILLPLLLLWPIARGKWSRRASDNKSEKYESEMHFLQSSQFWDSIFDLFFKHIFLHGLKALSCMCVAFLHRRHLMVWQIFAPRFIYEILSFLVVCVVSALMLVFLMRFRAAFRNWVKTNNFNLTPEE